MPSKAAFGKGAVARDSSRTTQGAIPERADTGFGGFTPPLWEHPGTAEQQVADWTRVYLIDPVTGVSSYYNYRDLVAAGIAEPGMSASEIKGADTSGWQAGLNDLLGKPSGGGRGRSGGSAAIEPGTIYQKPDERLVRESIRATMAALAGRIDPDQLNTLVGVYMTEDKLAFDAQQAAIAGAELGANQVLQQVDPMESVKAVIRDTAEYKAIHKLRPESVDEFEWISSRQGALKRAGVTDKMSESLGIAQATAGASTQEAVTAGNIATFSQSGQLLDELKERINVATYSALRLV